MLPAEVAAAFDVSKIKEVWLVRGSNMTICPFNNYSDEIKQRIKDGQPYYSGDEYLKFHPNPTNDASDPACKSFLYGQIELVPFGKEPTHVPSEYLYIFDGKIIREGKVLISQPVQFADEKFLYKKVLTFKVIDDLFGNLVELPNSLFWFRGTEVYGRIGDVSEGVVVVNNKYYRHDGAQTFVNNVLLWKNPSPVAETLTPGAEVSLPEAQVTVVTMSTEPIPTWYQPGIPWIKAPFGADYEGTLYPNSLQSFFNPPGRLIGFELDLPANLAGTQGLVATLQSCKDAVCNEKSFDEAMFVVDEKGRLLDRILYTTKVDLNTEYFRVNRKVYLLVGSKDSPKASGSKFKFYFGPDR